MSKSFGKFLLFTAVAGAAAYGAYSYLQKKEQPAKDESSSERSSDSWKSKVQKSERD